ncbi:MULTISPECIES: M20/M25/M40 family metallo-hydrolase [unclassified Streptomyces]|uniref:M20/M25/M40 family metallo-hydrolase n=1 Tax=unclassified Streptomyces TaxID=2593676 RepID=UPI002E100BE8|nr:M20/M25/M40 family metallo-hydrolase [Streptomyces sp. NBC_01197]WSS48812.1 M20/M25/M40 family metallo-hydrolase [Streptomyces sp. NBC_01180]
MDNAHVPGINAQRLLTDLTHLSQIGAGPDGSIHRIAGNKADWAGRDWIDKTMRVSGLHSYYDDTGNVFARRKATGGPWLLIGSHADTVPGGGHLDGAYGVIAAMEVLRTLHETGHPMADHVETVAWFDEEGVTPESNGGLVGSTALTRDPHADELVGYLELHVEQGPRMEASGLELSPVTGIVGVRRYTLTVRGQENHAGTTPFHLRADAGRVASRMAAALRDICTEADPFSIGNAGVIEFGPGAANVVPGTARTEIEIRAGEDATLDIIEAELRDRLAQVAVEESCTAVLDRTSAKPAARFDKRLVDTVDDVCRSRTEASEPLLSYAGHDASVISTRLPTAMLFVPSTGGFSHSNREHTPDNQLVLGTQALLDAVVRTSALLLNTMDRDVILAA